MFVPRSSLLCTALLTTVLGCGAAPALAAQVAGAAPYMLAQDAPAPAASGQGHRFGEILMSLGLSDQQKSQIRSIMQTSRQQNKNADPETRRANRQAAFKKIDAVLAPAQRQTLHAKLDAMRKGQESQPQ